MYLSICSKMEVIRCEYHPNTFLSRHRNYSYSIFECIVKFICICTRKCTLLILRIFINFVYMYQFCVYVSISFPQKWLNFSVCIVP